MNHNTNITVGTTVQAVFESPDVNASVETLGRVIDIKQDSYETPDFVATVLWDDGSLFAMNALFFNKTVRIVNRVSV